MLVTFNPIGTVKIEDGRYYIELKEKFFEATLGLDEFSHIQVIWWFNLYDSEESRNYFVMDKPYTNGPEKVGVLASRSPIRPNPIADAGIGNLSALKKAVSSPQKLSKFAAQTHISEEYLTILKRELGSLEQKPVPISDFPVLSAQTIQTLAKH